MNSSIPRAVLEGLIKSGLASSRCVKTARGSRGKREFAKHILRLRCQGEAGGKAS